MQILHIVKINELVVQTSRDGELAVRLLAKMVGAKCCISNSSLTILRGGKKVAGKSPTTHQRTTAIEGFP